MRPPIDGPRAPRRAVGFARISGATLAILVQIVLIVAVVRLLIWLVTS